MTKRKTDSCRNEKNITNFTNQVSTPPDSYHESIDFRNRASRLKKPTNMMAGGRSTANLHNEPKYTKRNLFES